MDDAPASRPCARCGRDESVAPRRTGRFPGGIVTKRRVCRDCELAAERRRRAERKEVARATPPCPPPRPSPVANASPPPLHSAPASKASVAQIAPVAPPRNTGLERILFISDIHVPFHDTSAVSVMLRAARIVSVDTVVILGDGMDCWSVSFHDKNPARRTTLKQEVEAMGEFLGYLEALNPKRKIYLEGNHEHRLQKFLARAAPALYDALSLPEMLRLADRGWEWVPYQKSLRLGKLHLTHDVKNAGKNAHRMASEKFRGSTIIGHTHYLGYEVRGVFDSSPHLAAMFGHLCELESVDYTHAANAAMWSHGFGLGWMETEGPNAGAVHVQPVPIFGTPPRCVVNGQLVC